jgi:hypothetical protein
MRDCVFSFFIMYSGIVYYLLHVCKLYTVCVWRYCGELTYANYGFFGIR